MAGQRIGSFREFFPYYLGEHRVPLCRALHFAGTTIGMSLLGYVAYGAITGGDLLGIIGVALFPTVLIVGGVLESKMNTAPSFLLGAVGVITADPLLGTLTIVSGYAFPWIGHFFVEGNRPATFQYPTWSYLSDLRMYSMMLTGRLWTGDSVPAEPASAA
jgi:hypothetical protein